MSAEEEVKTNETTPEVGNSETIDMRTEHAGSTPLPKEINNDKPGNEEQTENNQDGDQVPGSADPAPADAAPPSTVQADSKEQEGLGYPPIPQGVSQQQPQSQQQIPPTINHMAIIASAQNKLPVSKVKGIVLRLSRHTESSGQKTGKWFKNENYVDKDNYSWKNMSLFEDHQCHLWTPSGTVRGSYKK